MWRSFFLAVGIGLMLLGVQTLVLERVEINESAKLPKFLNRLFESDLSSNIANSNYLSGRENPQFADQTFANPAVQNSAASNFQNVPYSSQSRFGPSRFSGPQSGNYGGRRVDLSRSGLNSNASQTVGAFPVNFPYGGNVAGNTADGSGAILSPAQSRRARTLLTKDWMPWSLMAAGAIIFLYTSSQPGSQND